MFALSLAVLACSGATKPDGAPEAKPPAAPAPAAPAPAPAADVPLPTYDWGSRCEDGTAEEVIVHPGPQGARIVEAPCAFYAYQGSSTFYLVSDDQVTPLDVEVAERGSNGGWTRAKAVEVTGLVGDKPDGTIQVLTKARGSGDCGTWATYALQGSTLVLTELRSQECLENPPDETNPEVWPVVSVP